ncbi:hypothetical protein KPL35_12355 [Clostridium sp. CF011]|uniref:hypothetical protein n=1 Tax=Clostridium sp. CF011 TaxID=2843318 RepID=UPI001C0D8D3B|nr:hypothetical protein [Clostridium sp. CF011]MBU3092864.1 hypothetical protein [Clostridium sp. CF011]WAG71093.1 hypothetical protein LL036_06625 [Clostridium sp. CF011]
MDELKTADTLKIARLLCISEHSAIEYTAICLEYRKTSNIKIIGFYNDIEKLTEESIKCVDKTN